MDLKILSFGTKYVREIWVLLIIRFLSVFFDLS